MSATKNKRQSNDESIHTMLINNPRTNVADQINKKYGVPTPNRTQDTSTQLKSGKWSPKLLEPIYNFEKLMNWMEINTVHGRCIRVKAYDSIGVGYYFEASKEKEDVDRSQDAELQFLETFFDNIHPQVYENAAGEQIYVERENLTMLLNKVAIDYEACGNAAFEVSRTADGLINGLYHVSAPTLRWAKTKDKLAQVIDTKMVWFKLFGDKRLLNRYTGEFVKSELKPDQAANEIIYLRQYTYKSTVYGVPEWIPAVYPMFGDYNQTIYNIDFFLNFGVPSYAVVIEGGGLQSDQQENIKEYFRTHMKGNNHKTLVMNTPKNVTVRFEALNVGEKEASFRGYKKDNRDEILIAHQVPPYRVGLVEQGALGGNVAEEADKIYQSSVIQPRQNMYEWYINELIIKQGFGITGWVLRFEDLRVDDKDLNSRVHERYIMNGSMSPNEVRKDLGLESYSGGDLFYISGSLLPSGTTQGGGIPGQEDLAVEPEMVNLPNEQDITDDEAEATIVQYLDVEPYSDNGKKPAGAKFFSPKDLT